jgi:anhydro-N-acetylmuramic acid kinase
LGEKLLLGDNSWFLNLGGIANISLNSTAGYIAYDVCPANRVLNLLAAQEGKAYDENGALAATGTVDTGLLTKLNALPYYQQAYPKSLANGFGTETVYPLVQSSGTAVNDALRTYTEHIAQQVAYAVNALLPKATGAGQQLLITGGGALNGFLVKRIQEAVQPFGINVTVPDEQLINYKEALIMGLLGILRWREENTVLNSVTGAVRSSIGGAVWIGQEF